MKCPKCREWIVKTNEDGEVVIKSRLLLVRPGGPARAKCARCGEEVTLAPSPRTRLVITGDLRTPRNQE